MGEAAEPPLGDGEALERCEEGGETSASSVAAALVTDEDVVLVLRMLDEGVREDARVGDGESELWDGAELE